VFDRAARWLYSIPRNPNVYVRVMRRLSVVSPLDPPSVALGSVPEEDTRGLLQVGQIARITGKTVRAIHLYEDLGLLRPAERSKGRFRLYEKDAVNRVRWISKLQSAGFSLPELREILRSQEDALVAKDAAARLARAYEAKLREVEAKLSELHRVERELVTSLAYLDSCQSACDSELRVTACPSCDRHRDRPEPPPLVLGAFVQ
jgi:MerR family transcriptional regulator, copper efflux regulator